ncbi:LamG-like jellyroll fold domain-containing protein [Myxosarcina sp. GI1]|uniref:LamG-like jellyroll fold domain-containing protein n=1 Tax=Myxosarcina sp. GI1 TaxID=1541065 RepID=UPI00055A05DB|nr:LamG-like jellyroll fold domain-containing protein [Myxosarcina sp. GI1]
MQAQWENYLQTYSDRAYRHTTMVRHAGVLIAFALDSKRQIHYTVLDQENEPESIDARNWLATPQELAFPNEIAQVGFGILPNKVLPAVRSNDKPARHISEVDMFLSTTARLTADAPFQVISDNQYIYLFRQAIPAEHPQMVTVMDSGGEDVPMVNQTLLCDRFILAGTELKTVREVRYRRSRNKILGDGSKDSLGAVDMNNLPFYEPTLELDFVRNISMGRFTVALVPTGVPDVQRWQIFVHNDRSDRLDSYNIERSADGLFNTQGTESPAAFEKIGYAESALKLNKDTYVAGKARVVDLKAFNLSLWIKPESTGIIYSEGKPDTVFSLGIVETTEGYGIEIFSAGEKVSSVANIINLGTWHHISVSFSTEAEENQAQVSIQVDDLIVHEEDYLSLPLPTASATDLDSCLGKNIGEPANSLTAIVDELSIWDRSRSELEVNDSKNVRKTGNEPGLITYWQFDEGNGETIHDHADSANNGIIKGDSLWIQSDAPIGDNPGIRRSSFGFTGRTIAGKGLTALLYHQQEEKPSGSDGETAPSKQSARMLLAVATKTEGEAEAKIATLDFAVSRRGRLSQIPDEIELQTIGNRDVDRNASVDRIVKLESAIATLTIQITEKQNRLQQLRANLPRELELLQRIQANRPNNIRFGVSFRRWQTQLDKQQAKIENLKSQALEILEQLKPLEKSLEAKQEWLKIWRDRYNGNPALPMRLVHIDPNGLTVTGGLLDFAWTEDAPQLFASDDGMVRMYFRGSEDQFFSATYDTNVARAKLTLSDACQLQEKAPGLGRNQQEVVNEDDENPQGTMVTVSDGVDKDTCTFTLTNNNLNLTETWQRVPRNPGQMGRVISGQAREASYLGRLSDDLKDTIEVISLTEAVDRPYQVGASILVAGAKIALRKAIEPGDKAIAVVKTELPKSLEAGSKIAILEYDYDSYSNLGNQGDVLKTPYDLKYGSVLVKATWLPDGSVENVSATPLTGLSRPNAWLPESPGTALQINKGYLTGDSSEFAHQGSLSLEAWVKPNLITEEKTAYLVEQNSAAPNNSNYLLSIKRESVNTFNFNGQNEYVRVNNLDLTNKSFTVEFWAARNSNSLDNFFSTVISQGPPGNNRQLHCGFRKNGSFAFAFYGNDLQTQATYKDTGWHHWACTFDVETKARIIYRDGVVVAEDKATANFQGNGEFLIATLNNPSKQHFFHGAIDEVRIWQGVRNKVQINLHKDCRLEGDESGLTAYYYFAERQVINRTGNTAYDGRAFNSPTSFASPISYYQIVAGVRNRYLSTTEAIQACSGWQHLAASYQEAYAINFDGDDSYLDCGTKVSLGVDDGLSMDMQVAFTDVTQTYYPLLQKGRLGKDDPELTAWMYLRKSGNSYYLYFGYEDAKGRTNVTVGTVTAPQSNQIVNIAVTGSEGNDNYTVRLYWNGEQVAAKNFSEGKPVSSLQPLVVGRCYGTPEGTTSGSISGNTRRFLQGTISKLQVWNRALSATEVRNNDGDAENLAGNWLLNEGEGNSTFNNVDNSEARLVGATWTFNPDPSATRLDLYVNGMPVETENVSQIPTTANQFNLGRDYTGAMDEVRIWREYRSQEQVLDNMFGQLKGERDKLVAYYEFDRDPATTDLVTQANDSSLQSNHLTVTEDAEIKHILSQAPICQDLAIIRNALGSISNRFQGQIHSRPAIAEYADIQTAKDGSVRGVHKRCYSFLKGDIWYLMTGYKVGNLITEWISQVQFDPQIKGYIEGAPPVPSENLTEDAIDDGDGVTSVEFVEAESVTSTISTSKESGFNSSFDASLKASVEQELETVIAPFGAGISIKLGKVGASLGASTSLETELNWSSSQEQSNTTNVSKMTTVSLSGSWEDPANRLNSALPRRFQPSNVGFALVESETADLYAIRMAHNRALVAFRMVPNPDIPKDTNIIPFPIDPHYTKQGTLDGAIGYSDRSKVLDPDYAQATEYGEYSYFKPSEAYALRQRIQNEEIRLRAFYEDFSTTPPGATGVLTGGLAGGGLGALAAFPVAAPFTAAAGIAAGGLIDALASDNDLPQQYSKRNLVNSYLWTADGGTFAESTETTDTQQESTSGSYSFNGSASFSASASAEVAGVGIEAETNASFGGSLNLTKSKTKEASQSFSLNLENNTPGNLQKQAIDSEGNILEPEFDPQGNPINTSGKVDAYRFFSFYLTPQSDNYDALYNTVIDPVWLEQSNSPNARALRQAQQPQNAPACWRIFHRVTFISRILPEFPDPTAPPLDRAVQDTDFSSSYELIRLLQPFVENQTSSPAAFNAAARNAIQTYLPELSADLTQEVVLALADYFQVEGIN